MINTEISGKTLYFKLADVNDAEFIYSLRIDEKLNKHISKVSGAKAEQATWLSEYKKRELQGCEYYFLIIRSDNNKPIGTVRIYGITEDNRFCWGSWILNNDKTRTSAIESAYLVYKFAFENKRFASAYFQVDKNNSQVISFHKKTGAIVVSDDEVNENFIYTLECYKEFKSRYLNIVESK